MTRNEVLSTFDVSRETADKLDAFVAELQRWKRIKNLLAHGEADRIWLRHVADSLQLLSLVGPGTWLDLGSGAGFPGLVVAIARQGEIVHLVESDGRKCAFLRQVARMIAPNALIHAGRIEAVVPTLPRPVATVSARALAPLDQLLAWSGSLLKDGGIGLFPKGRSHLSELTEAAKTWRFQADLVPSRTDSAARIIRVHDFHGRKDDERSL